jgi:hypothetical protein
MGHEQSKKSDHQKHVSSRPIGALILEIGVNSSIVEHQFGRSFHVGYAAAIVVILLGRWTYWFGEIG